MELVIIAIFGLCMGSFLNVCIHRIPKKQSISYPPSSCTSCGGKITPLYLLPIIGYILAKGKCVSCKEKISIQYPSVELTGAAIAILIYSFTTTYIDALFYYNFFMVLLAITIIDFKTMTIPNEFIIYLILCSIPYLIFIKGYVNILVALGLGTFFLAIAVLSKGGMGGGDVKLAFVLGLYLGFPQSILAVFLSFILGGIAGLILLLKGVGRKEAIPFGPYLALGAVIAFFAGEGIISWYLKLVGLG